MKAVLTTQEHNAQNLAHSKETIDTREVAVVFKGEIITPVVARFYMGRSANASVVYCSLWVRSGPKKEGFYTSGHGSAGGWGYHKTSAAFNSAMHDAGITLDGTPYDRIDETPRSKAAGKRKNVSIGGCGDASVDSALVAIARALGFKGKARII